jgi:pre-mRNA cleavage complex 2 protein Pcf11
MLAYTQVDSQIRRKLDEMLKTWKEPVPGSLDPRPVFSADVTRPIETALIKARTQALQAQQEQDSKSRLQNRHRTSTPPVGWNNISASYSNGRPSSTPYGVPPNQNPSQQYPANGNVPQYAASQVR